MSVCMGRTTSWEAIPPIFSKLNKKYFFDKTGGLVWEVRQKNQEKYSISSYILINY